MMIVTRREERDRAFVLTLLRIRVKALVPLWRNGKGNRKSNCANQPEAKRGTLHSRRELLPIERYMANTFCKIDMA